MKNLKGGFSGFGGDQEQLKKVVSTGEGTLAGADGYTISSWGHSYGFIQT
jgi:hypothetical protein